MLRINGINRIVNLRIIELVSGRYNTSLGLYGIYCQGKAETNIAHTALDKLLYLT